MFRIAGLIASFLPSLQLISIATEQRQQNEENKNTVIMRKVTQLYDLIFI